MSDNKEARHIVAVSETDASYVIEFAKHDDKEAEIEEQSYVEEKSLEEERELEIVFTPEGSEDEFIFAEDLSEEEVLRFYSLLSLKQDLLMLSQEVSPWWQVQKNLYQDHSARRS